MARWIILKNRLPRKITGKDHFLEILRIKLVLRLRQQHSERTVLQEAFLK